MGAIDLVILLLLAWGGYKGWHNGLVKEAASTGGFILGLFIAFFLYRAFGSYLAPHLAPGIAFGSVLGRIFAFILIWVVVPIGLGFVANIITAALRGLHVGFFNSFTGLLLGVFKYLVLMSFIMCAMNYVGLISQEKKDNSALYKPVSSIGSIFFGDKKSTPEQDAQDVKEKTTWIKLNHSHNSHKK